MRYGHGYDDKVQMHFYVYNRSGRITLYKRIKSNSWKQSSYFVQTLFDVFQLFYICNISYQYYPSIIWTSTTING